MRLELIAADSSCSSFGLTIPSKFYSASYSVQDVYICVFQEGSAYPPSAKLI